jgi:hypothetical protein
MSALPPKADIAGIKVVPEIRVRSRAIEVSGSRVPRFDPCGRIKFSPYYRFTSRTVAGIKARKQFTSGG